MVGRFGFSWIFPVAIPLIFRVILSPPTQSSTSLLYKVYIFAFLFVPPLPLVLVLFWVFLFPAFGAL
jgi:hypothetical protein